MVNNRRNKRIVLTGVFAFTAGAVLAFAQSAAPPASSDAPEINQPLKFETTTKNLVAPVFVTDKNGNIIDGLQPAQFRLFDNGKEQNINVDPAYPPISLVVAIEKSSRVESVLPQVRKLGILLQQITGKDGQAAILGFDGRLQLLQDFTNDPDKLKSVITNIQAGSSQARMIDAVERGVYMLNKRPTDSRRILLLVSETHDEGSEARLRETMIEANLANVQIYSVDISHVIVELTQKPSGPRPSAIATTANSFPMGMPATPTTVEQQYGQENRIQFIPALKEIYTDAKGIFVRDPSTQFARSTGGAEMVFLKQKGFEDAIQRISQEIHSEYLISYKPTNSDEGGFHTIEVQIDRMPQYICKTRPGYWIGGGAQ